MATTTKTYGTRAHAARTTALGASGDTAETWGHQLSIFIDVDTADTVTVSLSPDGTNWIQEGTYTADTAKVLPPAYAVKATWTASSKVWVHGLNVSK